MLERAIQRQILKYCKEQGIMALKMDSSSTRGFPDLIVILPTGRILFCELKTKTGVLSPLQKRLIDKLEKQNAEVYVLRSIDEFKAVLTAE